MSEEWVRIAIATSAVAVSLAAALVSWLQWSTARQKLTAELYDRRIACYRSVLALVIDVGSSGRTRYQQLMQFARDVSEASTEATAR